MRIPHLVLCSVTLTAASCACAAEVQFPSRPIRLVVGTTPGSSPDLIARIVSKQAESYLMLVHPSLPAHTVKEFIALAKQKQLTYSSSPVGATTHLATELFETRKWLDQEAAALKLVMTELGLTTKQ